MCILCLCRIRSRLPGVYFKNNYWDVVINIFKLIWFLLVAETSYSTPRWIHFRIMIKLTMGRIYLKDKHQQFG